MLDSAVRRKWKVLFTNTLGRVQIHNKKNKVKNLINDDLDLSSSDDESDNKYDNESDLKIDLIVSLIIEFDD